MHQTAKTDDSVSQFSNSPFSPRVGARWRRAIIRQLKASLSPDVFLCYSGHQAAPGLFLLVIEKIITLFNTQHGLDAAVFLKHFFSTIKDLFNLQRHQTNKMTWKIFLWCWLEILYNNVGSRLYVICIMILDNLSTWSTLKLS